MAAVGKSSGKQQRPSLSVSSYTFRPCAVSLDFSDLAYSVRVNRSYQKSILQRLSGSFSHGKLNCIMGPSGAGKSSLLNVLAGFNKLVSGRVSVNGEQLAANNCSRLMAAISSYIMQDDFLIGELSVRETLTFAAQLKTPSDVPSTARARLADDLLRKMGLVDVVDRSVACLSGGQRKRVAVAVELVNYPPVLFLDEPTTGLDSTSCYRLVELLKAVASVGCNVIATVHQPNSRVFRVFDSLYVLAPGGRLAYSGPPMALTAALRRTGVACPSQAINPADLLFDGPNIVRLADAWPAISRFVAVDNQNALNEAQFDPLMVKWRLSNFDGDDAFIKAIKTKTQQEAPLKNLAALSQMPADELIEYCSQQRASAITQFRTLLTRSFLQAKRDRVFCVGRLTAYLLSTVLLCSTFQFVGREASKLMINIGFMYLLTTLPLVGTSIVTVLHFPINFNVLLSESINSWYSVSAFYLSRAVVDNVFILFVAWLTPLLMWLLSGQLQYLSVAVPILTLLMSLHSMTTHHFSYIIAMVGDENSLPYLPFSVCMLHTLFSGFMIPMNALPSWIAWIKFVYFGAFTYRATLLTAYAPLKNGSSVQIPCGDTFYLNPLCAFKKGEDVLDFVQIDYSTASVWRDMAVLAANLSFFFILGWILLAIRLHRAKKAIARV